MHNFQLKLMGTGTFEQLRTGKGMADSSGSPIAGRKRNQRTQQTVVDIHFPFCEESN